MSFTIGKRASMINPDGIIGDIEYCCGGGYHFPSHSTVRITDTCVYILDQKIDFRTKQDIKTNASARVALYEGMQKMVFIEVRLAHFYLTMRDGKLYSSEGVTRLTTPCTIEDLKIFAGQSVKLDMIIELMEILA